MTMEPKRPFRRFQPPVRRLLSHALLFAVAPAWLFGLTPALAAPTATEEDSASATSPLAAAVERGDAVAVIQLLSGGADPNAADSTGATAVHAAAEQGSVEVARLLVEAGASVSAARGDGKSPLGIAAGHGHWGATEAMLDAADGELPPDLMDALLTHKAPGPSLDDGAVRARLAVLAKITSRFPDAVNRPNARGQMPLHIAVGAGDAEFVEPLLAAGADPNARDPGGRSALVYALERRNVTIADRLIAAGAVLEPQAARVIATAASTARAGDPATFRFYLDHGLDPNARDAASRPILFAAIAGGNDSLVDVLIAAGANVHQAEPLGATALHVASLHGRAAMVAALLRAGADANAKASSATHGMRGGTTPLHWGVKHPDVVRALVAHGADINAADSDGQTPLLLSLFGQHTASALFLLESGANPNLGTKDFMYPILPALEWPDVTAKLIAAGADVNIRDRDQLTPLFFAIKRKRVNLVSLLAEAGADPSAMGPRGTTLVHHAAELPGALDILVKHGANPNARDSNGNTALLLAAATGASESASALLKAGADIHAANAAGDTPLHVAIRNDRLRVVEILLGAGADPGRVNHSGTTPLALGATASEPIRRVMSNIAPAASSTK